MLAACGRCAIVGGEGFHVWKPIAHARTENVFVMRTLGTPLALLALGLALAGCPRKASWIANEQGGYALFANVESIDQAVIRFQRTARDLCGTTSPYSLSEPRIIAQGFQGGAWAPPTSTVTVRTELTCNR